MSGNDSVKYGDFVPYNISYNLNNSNSIPFTHRPPQSILAFGWNSSSGLIFSCCWLRFAPTDDYSTRDLTRDRYRLYIYRFIRDPYELPLLPIYSLGMFIIRTLALGWGVFIIPLRLNFFRMIIPGRIFWKWNKNVNSFYARGGDKVRKLYFINLNLFGVFKTP